MKYFFLILGLFSGCGKVNGPIDIKWDRDTCEHCRMVLSDKRFVAQIQGGPGNQVYLFDDFGCAVNWLATQAWREEKTIKIWVADARLGNWLDARQAYYVGGQVTPMDFGLGAVAQPVPGSINFTTAKAQLLAKSPKLVE